MFVEILLFLIGALLILRLIIKPPNARIRAFGQKLPGPKRLPIVGNIFQVPRNGAEGLELRKKFIKQYGHIQRFWIGNELFIMLSDPNDCQVIFNSTTQLNKGWSYEFLVPWLGTGLLTSTGQKWHARRKALTPTFHFKILEQFLGVFNKNGDVLLKLMEKEAGGDKFDVQPYLCRYALDVICETAMGVTVNAQKDEHSPYVSAVRRMCVLLFKRINQPWLWNNLVYALSGRKKQEAETLNVLHNFTSKVISEKKEKALANPSDEILDDLDSSIGKKSRTAFLEMLISLSKKASSIKTDEDIREEVDTFMFEGHDTTTAALCCTLYLLGKHQDVQEKLFQELEDIMPTCDHELSYQDLQNLKYLERVIKESLRLYPSVPAVGRLLTDDVQVPSGYTLPKGATVIISVWYTHRNENFWEDPDKFDPDRFLPERSTSRHPFSYVPFSAGPRNCIGQKFAMLELKASLAKLVRKFNFQDAGPGTDILPNPTLILQSLNGYNIKIRNR